jgi:hypothetical protein
MANSKFDVPLLPIDMKKLDEVSPIQRGKFLPNIGVEDWRFSGPAGRNPYDTYGRPHLFYPYKVTSQDDWSTVTARANLSSPAELIAMNFFGAKDDPAVVNWYLRNYVGCVHSRDGSNCSFSNEAKPGIIWLPLTPYVQWPPIPKIEPWNCNVVPVDGRRASKFKGDKQRQIFGTNMVVRPGMYLMSPQGVRCIVGVNSQEFLFTLVETRNPKYEPYLGVLMSQPNGIMCGRSEVLGGLWGEIGARGASLRAAAEWEMEILMGLLAGGGKVLQIGIATAKGIDFVLSDKVRGFELHFEALTVTLKEMYKLRNTSPVLFEIFIGGLFAEAKKQIGANAASSPNGAIAGWVFGEVGPEIISGRIDLMKTVADGMEKLAKTLAKSLEKNAKDKAIADYKKDSVAFVNRLQAAGVAYTPETEAALIAELEKHPDAIGNALSKIGAAFARVR